MPTRKPCYDPFGFSHNDISEFAKDTTNQNLFAIPQVGVEGVNAPLHINLPNAIGWAPLYCNQDDSNSLNETTNSNNEEDKNMKGNELVKIWYDKNEKELEAEYNKKIADLKETDPAKMAVDDLVKAANKVMDTYEMAPVSIFERLTKETRVEIDKLRIEESEKRDALMQKRILVESQLDMCDCYEQRREVLIAYGILNEKGIMV